jgi:hypothetical protein
MLVLLSNPRIGLSLALEAGISAGESTEFIDVHGERAVRFRDDPIISHASNMACDRVSANRGQAAAAACYNETDPLPRRRLP